MRTVSEQYWLEAIRKRARGEGWDSSDADIVFLLAQLDALEASSSKRPPN